MKKITKEELKVFLRKHKLWLANDKAGERADLSGADLREANLRRANLSGADLDYSCLPLWCGSLSANFDDKQIKQIAYHLVKAGLNSKNTSDNVKKELEKIIDLANGFHRVVECGKIAHQTEKGGEQGWTKKQSAKSVSVARLSLNMML